MNIENLKNDILRNYNDVLQSLNNWTEQSFLDSLVNLETSFANYILQALNIDRYTKHVKWWENSKYIDNIRLEHTISDRILWVKTSIMSLLNQWIKKFTQNKQNPDTSTDYKKTSENQENPLDQTPLDINDNPPNINYEIINKPEIQEIINTVQSHRNRNTDYAIRYVVVMISRLVKRDVNFFFSTEEEKIKQLQFKTYNDYPNVICKTLSELIRDVLYLLWINSKVVIATNTKVPLYALIVEGENGKYFIDALHDLFRSQHRIQPDSYWAYNKSNTIIVQDKDLTILSLDDIRCMDIDMKLIESQYFNDYIENIKQNLIDRNKAKLFFTLQWNDAYELLKHKIGYISESYLNVFPIEWPLERVAFHVYLRSNLYNKSEKDKFRIKNDEDDPNYPVIIRIQYGRLFLTYKEIIKYSENWRKYLLKKESEYLHP